MSIPNVQFYGVVHQLIEGNWTYQREGILDETHLRFFTLKEIEKLVKNAGLYIQRIEETLDPKYVNFQSKDPTTFKLGRISINDLTPEEIRRFFVFQYKIIAGKISSNKKDEVLNDINMEENLNDALNDYENDEYKEAINKYETVLQTDPTCAEALAGMGNCYMRLQKPEEAEASFIKAKTFNPENYIAWLGLGLLELYRENMEQAEFNLKRAIKINPESDRAYCALGILNSKTENFIDAEAYYCRALNLNIENLVANKSLIDLSFKTKRFDSAYKYLNKYLDIYPANLNMLFAMAGLQFKMGSIEDSLRTLDNILSIDPKHKYALEFQKSILTLSVN